MFSTLTGKLKDLMRRPGSLAQYLMLGLVLAVGASLAYISAAPEKMEEVNHQAIQRRASAGMEEMARLVIVQWMKGHSRMPEHILSRIYSVAMNSANADLVLAICLVESNFNPGVASEKGAIGLMGIMPDVWLEELKTHGIVSKEDDLYSISSNINSGLFVLERYLSRTNNLREALIRYAGGDPEYAKRVLSRLAEISRVRRSEEPAARA